MTPGPAGHDFSVVASTPAPGRTVSVIIPSTAVAPTGPRNAAA